MWVFKRTALWRLLLMSLLTACQPNEKSDDMTLSIQQVKQAYTAELLAMPHVASVGIGLNQEKQPSIIIGVEQLTVQLADDLPKTLEGYPVEVQLINTIEAQ